MKDLNPKATIVHADSELIIENPEQIKGKRVLCVEDGPTLTHGEMKLGAAVLAAQRFGASEIVDPRPWVEGTIKETSTSDTSSKPSEVLVNIALFRV